MKSSEVIGITICLLLVLAVAGCTDSNKSPPEKLSTEKAPVIEQSIPASTAKESNPVTTSQNKGLPVEGENLTVHFLDVGQGDSILIEYNNRPMLIDAGESDKGEVVSDYLHDQGISTLDYVVATHPHSDHIGGMNDVL